ncbi:MAG: hypothetical protein J4F36_10815 [Nitrosopumilaceae archaeon]|nr:hypothetical protein [Nitrosopumilaceae archaeon]
MFTKTRAKKIVQELSEQRLITDKHVLEFLEKSGVTTSREMIAVLDAMLDLEAYPDFFVSQNFAKYAESSTEFLNLVLRLCKKDISGYSTFELNGLYEKDALTMFFLYDRLKKLDEYKIALTVGYLLGGMGKAEPKKLLEIVDNNKSPTTNEKISYACAFYSIAQENKLPKKYRDLLLEYMESDSKELKHHATSALMFWFNDVKKIQTFLLSFAKKNIENRYLVLQNTTFLISRNHEFSMKILKLCSKTTDEKIIASVAHQLGLIAKHYPMDVLKIIKKWCKIERFLVHGWPQWAAGEAGKTNLKDIEQFLLKWINAERNYITFRFHLPTIIDEIYKDKDSELKHLLSKVDYKDTNRSEMILKIIQQSLSEGYGKTQREKSFLQFCNSLVIKIAKHQELEIHVDPDAKEPVMNTLALVSAVEFGKKKIPSSEIKKNLRDFPNVVSFFGKRKLFTLIEEKPFHPLVKILSRVPVSDDHVKRILKRIDEQDELWKKGMMLHTVKGRYYNASLFFDMNTSFAMFGDNEQGRASIRDGLMDEKSFFQTLIELNVAARFKKKFSTVLQPPIKEDNKLDVAVNIDGTECLFEIYSPKEDLRLKYVRTAHSMKNKAKSGILTKLKRQLKSAKGLGKPVVVIVDKTNGASVSDIEITDLLFGSMQYTLEMDKKDGKVINEYASRKRDSVSELSEYGSVISAVILLNRDMDDNDFKVKLYGETFLNPNADIPLNKELVEKIESTLLRQPIL